MRGSRARSLSLSVCGRSGRPAFTLLELVVVLLVLGILAAVAVPTFSTVKKNSVVRVTQSALEALDRNGEAIAVSDPDLSDAQVAEAALGEVDVPDGMTITRDGSEITVENVSGSVVASGAVTFSGGTGTIVDAAVIGGGGSTTTTAVPVTTTTVAFSVSYASTSFSRSQSSQTRAPTVSGGAAASFSVSGALPSGVSFDTVTGVFTGPSSWSFTATRVEVGREHTCALTSSGGVKCWGHNGRGQLGDGTTTDRSTPVDVVGLSSGVTSISASTGSGYGGRHTCALTSSGGVKCWGANDYGQLGDGSSAVESSTPVDVSGLSSGVTSISAGGKHTCALLSSGGVKCWGHNWYGSLGDGTDLSRPTPVDVSGLTSGVSAVDAGDIGTCALTSSGGVKCWGANDYGQVGDGTTTMRTSPVDVFGLSSGVTQVSVGGVNACALLSSGGVKCWGGGDTGKNGDGTLSNRSLPVNVSGLTSGVLEVSVGLEHSCARVSGDAAKCWGRNTGGRVGDWSTTQRLVPVNVSGLSSGVTRLVAGGVHSCGIVSGGLSCWGVNDYGQVGDGSSTDRLVPTAVSGMGGAPGWPAPVSVTVTSSDGATASVNVTLVDD